MRAARILYVQHASALGGSTTSLLYTLSFLDRARFEPVVALARPTAEVVRAYEGAGVRTLPWPGLVTFEHTTAAWTAVHRPLTWLLAGPTLKGWAGAVGRTHELVAETQPDLVHLNSVVLVPSAAALRGGSVPFVWHVRESPTHGHLGLRTALLRRALLSWPDEIIFLAEAEKQAWVSGQRGVVVPNYFDLRRFAQAPSRGAARASLGIDERAPVVLFVGGFGAIKGATVLFDALATLRARFANLVCLMPAAVDQPTGSLTSRLARAVLPLFGSGAPAQMALAKMNRLGLGDLCLRLPFAPDLERLYAAADVLAFPALGDHFARPVAEAAAARRPSVASNLPTLAEQIRDGETGLLVPPGDAGALAAALGKILGDPVFADRLGGAAAERARRIYDARTGVAAIMRVYDDVLARRTRASTATA